MADAVEAYFAQLRDIHNSGAGVAETSFYGPLAALLNDVGHRLKPKVSAIINLRNTGAGIPDGGLFTANQLKGWSPGEDLLVGQLPARGAIEVKGPSDDVFAIAESEQVARYVDRYGLVLVTNLRDFVLVGREPSGAGLRTLESCQLSSIEVGFWARVQEPRSFAQDAGEGLTEFLKRVLLHNAPLSDPKDLAWFLASYARTARLRLESRHELPALAALRSQLEESLGLKFEGDKGDHFFRSTLVQTLFYGMFASWVLWARDKDRNEEIPWDRRFQWETASQTLHVPMVAELFYQFSNPGRLRDLHIDEVLEWAEEILWRVDRGSFFDKFREEHAVQYFYEPFLEAFDPQLRKELGVWYTPDEVVRYMVARVDTVLREELGIADGLADKSVVVLDPCCGTGAYLVEVLRKIDETLTLKGADALTRQDVKRAAMSRVIGFEIMPAPFVVAHLQMGILLAELGVPLRDVDERAAIYLTNALTGWGDGSVVAPPKDRRVGEGQMHSTLLFPEFAHERDAADRVKREEPILVVIGNPPYNGFAGMAVDEERDLSDAYRATTRAPKPQGRGLNDLYVRFFRIAERQIAQHTGRGVVSLISNYSWLDGFSYTGMRERFLDAFDSIWIDNLNGDKFRTGKLTPQGKPDPSVFSTPANREGIGIGTSIAVLVRSSTGGPNDAQVKYRDFWGASKLADLDAESTDPVRAWSQLNPGADPMLAFSPRTSDPDFVSWPTVEDLFAEWSPGVTTARDIDLVSIDRSTLQSRIAEYLNPARGLDELHAELPQLTTTTPQFDAGGVRAALLDAGPDAGEIMRYAYRPFDTRWVFWTNRAGLLDRRRGPLIGSIVDGQVYLVSRPKAERSREGLPFSVVSEPCDHHFIRPNGAAYPWLQSSNAGESLFDKPKGQANVSERAVRYLHSLDAQAMEDALMPHAVAVMAAPAYLEANADGIAAGWPRVPLPDSHELLRASSEVGLSVIRLLNPGAPVDLSHKPLTHFGSLSSMLGDSLDPATELGVSARWGVAGRGGICMPSTGRLIERPYTENERTAIVEGAESLGMSAETATDQLGETCFDIYLNDIAYWRCVPANVWRYTIGGYQVIKKWLSYREHRLLGRDLTVDEARYVTEMVRRIAALVLMGPDLDDNYERVKANPWDWNAVS